MLNRAVTNHMVNFHLRFAQSEDAKSKQYTEQMHDQLSRIYSALAAVKTQLWKRHHKMETKKTSRPWLEKRKSISW